jgi:allantoin racemase
MPHVVVINPSSSAEITAAIQTSLDQAAHRWGVTATAVTSYGGPRAVESDEDARAAVGPMLATAGQHRADAYVVGSFADTGLEELRAAAPIPVISIAEAALISAMSHSRRVGVVSTQPLATFRHELYWARLGVSGRVVADLAIGRSPFDLTSRDAANDVLNAARELVSRRGAQSVILADPGMGHLRGPLAEEIGVPVIEPCTAAVAMAVQAMADSPRPRPVPEPAYESRPPAYESREPAYHSREPAYESRQPAYDSRYERDHGRRYDRQVYQ